MKSLLVPIDFSANAIHAAHYACQLAIKQKARVHLVHAVETPTIPGDSPIYFQYATALSPVGDWPSEKLLIQQAHTQMQDLVKELIDTHGIDKAQVNIQVDAGKSINVILHFVSYLKAELVVMGVKHRNLWQTIAQGSIAYQLLSALTCPCLVVPPHVSYSPIEELLFASDFYPEDAEELADALEFFPAKRVHCVHIDDGLYTEEAYGRMMAQFKEHLPQERVPLTWELKSGGDVFHELSSALKQETPYDQLLILNMHPRNWVSKLFEPSVTQEAIERLTMPILVMKRTEIRLHRKSGSAQMVL